MRRRFNGSASANLRILRDGTDVTNLTKGVIIGEKITLASSVSLPDGVSATSQNWSMGGTYVGGFTSAPLDPQSTTCPVNAPDASASSGHPCAPQTIGAQVTFYYTDAGTNVPATLTVTGDDNKEYKAATAFNVVKPAAAPELSAARDRPSTLNANRNLVSLLTRSLGS